MNAFSLRLLAPLAMLLLGAAPAARPTERLLLGFTYTHLQVRCGQVGPAPGKRREAGVAAADNVLLNYGTGATRTKARQALDAMRRQGADAVRTIVWLRLRDAAAGPAGPEVLGLLPAPRGHLSPEILRNLVDYATDVRATGYHRLFLPISAQIEGTPKCRRLAWGDCFDPASMPRTWSAIQQIARAVAPLDGPDFRVMLDVAPESCPELTSRDPIHQTMASYTGFMTQHYASTFGGGFIASCGAGPTAAIAARRVHALVDLYRAEHVQPAALDLHIYDQPADEVRTTLLMMEGEAERLDTPFFILETYADHPSVFALIRELRGQGWLPSLKIVAAFPLERGANCQESLGAPFSLQALRATAGT